jgi:hypothetical protein
MSILAPQAGQPPISHVIFSLGIRPAAFCPIRGLHNRPQSRQGFLDTFVRPPAAAIIVSSLRHDNLHESEQGQEYHERFRRHLPLDYTPGARACGDVIRRLEPIHRF